MRTLATALSLLIVFLAGCADDPAAHDDCEVHEHDGVMETHGACPAESPDAIDPTPTAGPAGNTSNTPPEASLGANVTSGEAPLSVTFSINVTDVDGDAVSWTLDADGDGTPDLEGNGTGGASFTYESQGNFTAVLNATDGSATATASLGITVHAAVPQGPCGAEPEPCVIAEDKWVFFWSNGECHVKPDYYDEAAGHYLNDRPGSLPVVGGDAPYGTGFVTGGGTWVYEESNGVPGLQIGTSAEAANYTKCANPDTLIF